MLKVLHLWMGDSPQTGGGGGGSMYRLHSNLRKAGVDSRILCELKTTNDPHVYTKPRTNRAENLIRHLTSRIGLNDIHRISSRQVAKHPQFQWADVINFHGIHSGFLSYLSLPYLTALKPTVFTVRDMWSMTGHCGFNADCERWQIGCGKCPYLDTYPPVRRDATALEWKLKDWMYQRSIMTIVAISRWIAKQVRLSMLSRFPVRHIYNGVDTDIYEPLDKLTARQFLGIPLKSRVILASAINLNDRRKGGDLLVKALNALPRSLNPVLLTMGRNGSAIAHEVNLPSIDLGYLSNQRMQCMAFSAADLFLFPSRNEALGQVVLESMACGTPVVALNTGPLPEMVRPQVTGVLAKEEDHVDLSLKMYDLLENDQLRECCSKNGRRVALEEFSVTREAEQYLALYQQLIEQGRQT